MIVPYALAGSLAGARIAGPSASPATAGRSFAALLSPDASHADSFAAPGMFGHRFPSIGGGEPKEQRLPLVAGEGSAAVRRAGASAFQPSAADFRTPLAAPSGSHGGDDAPSAEYPSALPIARGDAVLIPATARSAPIEEAERMAEPSRSRPSAPATKAPPRGNGPSLVVGGEGTLLRLIARVPGNDREADLRLRRRLEEVAAEFGLELADLHLNGSASAPDFATMTGGPHGYRPG